MNPTPFLELSGQGRPLGQAHGEHFRDRIREFSSTLADLNLSNIPARLSRQDLADLCMGNVPHMARYSPVLFEELEGIAEGAGLGLADVLMLNCFLELNDLRAPMVTGRVVSSRDWGCTSFNLKPRATEGGQPLLGQTYDMERYFADFNAILRIAGPGGHARLVFTLCGVLGLNGLNPFLAVAINKLVPTDSRAGVIYPMLVRQALDQERVGDALSALAFAHRASGMCFQLSSPDGLAFCLETTAARHDLLDFRHGLAHSNHYLSPALRPLEADWLTQGGSFVRLQVAQELLDDFQGRISLDHLKGLCADHRNHPRGVCAHALDHEGPHEAMATIAAVIMEPKAGILHFAGCHPCQQTFSSYGLARP
ncbi:MAG: C45 family autoproteolytic acyltransferase/hydrolase [Deltaproteobacteria bacterium]|nr:C45 family autoproteolytic acyltransferase/hydrolase [Deltaproteobacteria bacterium]